jgi:hypothetical protein
MDAERLVALRTLSLSLHVFANAGGEWMAILQA